MLDFISVFTKVLSNKTFTMSYLENYETLGKFLNVSISNKILCRPVKSCKLASNGKFRDL